MSLQTVRRVLDQVEEISTVERVFFEGGEPFLYYAVLVATERRSALRPNALSPSEMGLSQPPSRNTPHLRTPPNHLPQSSAPSLPPPAPAASPSIARHIASC